MEIQGYVEQDSTIVVDNIYIPEWMGANIIRQVLEEYIEKHDKKEVVV